MTTVQIRNAAIGVAIIGAVASAYWWSQRAPEQSAGVLPVALVAAPAVVTEAPVAPVIVAAPHYPVLEADPPHSALPALDASDRLFIAALKKLVGHKSFSALVRPEKLIRNLVVTVDNLPRAQAVSERMPVMPLSGHFAVNTSGGIVRMDPANGERFRPLVDALQWISVPGLLDLYARYYPLFQTAYVELGYPKGYFNDRLVVALDDLLATPQVDSPMELTQSKVLFEFADPSLESRSAGQKIMLRMGSDNALKVKAFLVAVRDGVTQLQSVRKPVTPQAGKKPSIDR